MNIELVIKWRKRLFELFIFFILQSHLIPDILIMNEVRLMHVRVVRIVHFYKNFFQYSLLPSIVSNEQKS